jgi:hypothetical protein
MALKSSLTNKNKFERKQMDEFILETVKIGNLKKIRIGHDDSGGLGSAWHLQDVTIDCPSLGKTWFFPCNRWLSKKDDDGMIERELYPQELETASYRPCESNNNNNNLLFYLGHISTTRIFTALG